MQPLVLSWPRLRMDPLAGRPQKLGAFLPGAKWWGQAAQTPGWGHNANHLWCACPGSQGLH